MTAVPAHQRTRAQPRPFPQHRPGQAPRAHLRPVSAPSHQRSLASFAWTCISIIVAALAAMLIINTQMAAGAYDRRDMRLEIAALHQQRAALVTQLDANAAPHHLSQAAAALGMVPATTVGFISLGDAQVTEADGGVE